jgi:hypothetical protein
MVNQAGLAVTMGCSVEETCPGPMHAKIPKSYLGILPDAKEGPIAGAKNPVRSPEVGCGALEEPTADLFSPGRWWGL